MTLDELVSVALLGVRSAAGPLPKLPEEISAILPTDGGDVATKLLDAAAALALYGRAGSDLTAWIEPPQPAPGDRWPECSSRAADILAQSFAFQLRPLLEEWLDLAMTAQRRPPHRLLPQLLEAAAGDRGLRGPVSAVVDERGRWLMQFNRRWQFASLSAESPQDVWQTGNRQQRSEALRAVRAADCDKAAEMIAATWKDDGAEERAEWVACLQIGLCDADEEFLEACLDDRSVRVREASADLLARLPSSRFATRMIERARALLSFTSGESGKLLKLKRAKDAVLEVALPEAFDKAMQRDGIAEKPSESIGPRQWWLLQMLGYVPLRYWQQAFQASPAEIVAAAPEEHAPLLVRGWLMALSRGPEVEWIEPLLAAAGDEVRLEPAVLGAIPTAQRGDVLAAVLRGSGRKDVRWNDVFEAWRPLDVGTSRMLLDAVDLPTLMAFEAQFYLHPGTLGLFEKALSTVIEMAEHERKADWALSVVALRRELHKEFAG